MIETAIDGGAAARICWELLYPKGRLPDETRTHSPLIDFGARYLKFLCTTMGAYGFHDGFKVILCLDPKDSSTLFRKEYLKDFYRKYFWVYGSDKHPGQYLCSFDGKYRGLKYDKYKGEWTHSNLGSKQALPVIAALDQKLKLGDLPDKAREYVETHIKPNYKYGRVWPYKHCTKQSFNELRYETAKNICGLMGVEVFEDPRLEADDLMFRAATRDKDLDYHLLTVDGDLSQTTLYNKNTRIFRMDEHKYSDKTQLTLKYDLWMKILRGEPDRGSDYIMSTVSRKKKNPITPDAAKKLAKKLVDEKDVTKQMAMLEAETSMVTTKKNMDMVMLAKAPAPTTVPYVPKSKVTLEDLHVTQREVDFWMSSGRRAVFKGR